MNLKHLHLMETLARTGSLRKAAEELGTSQPRLTKQLQQMERDLGVPLFHRSPRGLSLSVQGHAFLPFAYRIRSTFDLAQAAISTAAKDSIGLRIGVSITASMHLVPANLMAFHRQYPETLVSVTRATPNQLLEGLESHRFDLCLGLELPESSLFTRDEVFSTRMAGFSATSTGAATSQGLESFCRFPLILPPRSCGTRTLLDSALRRLGVKPRIVMELDDVSTILALVKAGVAATILPRIIPISSRALVVTELHDFIGEVKGTLLYPRNPTPEARSFVQIVSHGMRFQTA